MECLQIINPQKATGKEAHLLSYVIVLKARIQCPAKENVSPSLHWTLNGSRAAEQSRRGTVVGIPSSLIQYGPERGSESHKWKLSI